MSDSAQFSPCPCQKLQLTDHAKDHAGPAGFSSQLGNFRHMTPTAKPIPATSTSRSITCPATDKQDSGQCMHACQHHTPQPDGCGQVDKQGALQINCRCSETEPPPSITQHACTAITGAPHIKIEAAWPCYDTLHAAGLNNRWTTILQRLRQVTTIDVTVASSVSCNCL